ncbi:MAG: tRNA pseudouridine(38-40) synthase TruA [Gammaproteobacteria bacterium]|nr:tRNA pseudouridine(38-40) synthase TruA [Gammaproteobacteria bacterium]MBU6509570.1 tRNA pseudouridine(38-40) synthase TruA [Gammaproteobacteria bacterium]MDE1983427.1 tRNA pseudouridine(38-40) synthase TruA [Gammaproteobacteria bacterium]MDE2107938.1 tRNA pseudouridine(38-40) synthase TruA [Gammaproteobacteria bacterium]MDE2460401.1 tRNA pseudouridine(38-40) synthase TruA [Gammaproteobacteria bacterium]
MRLAIGLEYDGTRFMGWQRQAHPGRTVQACVEAAVASVADHPVELTCAGRTDAGVHASGQVAHFDTQAQRSARSWLLGINSNLPKDVALRWILEVPEDFHARFRARARHYRYTIVNRPTRPALARLRGTWVHAALDIESMQAAARHLLGQHDFSAFRAVECQARSPVRTLQRLDVRRRGERVTLEVVADGFLHHMVRNIAGVLIAIGAQKHPSDWAHAVLQGRDRKLGGVTAPPQGLCFVAVLYPPAYTIPVPEDALFDGLPAGA